MNDSHGEGDAVNEVHKKTTDNIDINRLIYTPKPPKSEKIIDKITGKSVDYTLVIANFCSLILAMYHLLFGMTILSFSSSIQSILDESTSDTTAVLHTVEDASPSTISLVLIGSGIAQIMNAFGGTYACIQGFKNVLILHFLTSAACLLGEMIFTGLIFRDALCNLNDIHKVQEKLLDYIRLFGTEAPQNPEAFLAFETAAFQLDSVQIGLSCCGAMGWSDYLNPDILQIGNISIALPVHTDLDGIETVFPSSCCRAWWVRNVHCSKGVHLWAHPAVDKITAFKFRQRINQAGCMWRIKLGCDRVLKLITTGLLVVTSFDVLIVGIKFACVFKSVRGIQQIIQKKKEIIANDIGAHHDEDVDPDEIQDRQPLPTEDEIEIIKARSDFNKFEARVKRTQIGKWMKQARKSVYMTFSAKPVVTTTNVSSRRMSLVDMRRKSLTGYIGHNPNAGDTDDEQFLDAEQVLKLEIQKQMKKQDERRLRDLKVAQLPSQKGAKNVKRKSKWTKLTVGDLKDNLTQTH